MLVAPTEMRAIPMDQHANPTCFLSLRSIWTAAQRRVSGPADLIVEVVSDDSVSRDRSDKFYEYQAAGVRILDYRRPGYERADFYVLDTRGRYQPVPIDPDGRYHSTVLAGFWFGSNGFCQRRYPTCCRRWPRLSDLSSYRHRLPGRLHHSYPPHDK